MEIFRKKVLVVDDDNDWLDMIGRRLKRYGIEPVRACCGMEAIKILDRQVFDLVITDTNMPSMDGITLLKFIRAGFSNLPVIVFFSGLWGSPISVSQVRKLGATAVLEKREAQSFLDLVLHKILSSSPQDETKGASLKEDPLRSSGPAL